MDNKTIQFFGPFFTNSSFARITRGLAFGINNLNSNYKAYVSGNQTVIDYYPTNQELDKNPDLKTIFKPEGFQSDVVIYNSFPKTITNLHGLANLPGKIKLMYLSWEESIYPKLWVDEINQNLHGILSISNFVKDLLVQSGVKIPITVIPIAVNNDWRLPVKESYPLKTKKKIKFYHNSTGKKRKGVDLLIKAYFNSFTNQDDVCLVLKTTYTVENQFIEIINSLKKENSPEVELIVDDLSDIEMAKLQASVDASIYPSRAEGYGIPALESMLLEKPVIVTNYGGFTDFCKEDNSYLVKYTLEDTDTTELINPGAKWANPDLNHLESQIKKVFKALSDLNNKVDSTEAKELKEKINKAKKVAQEIKWEESAQKSLDFIKEMTQVVDLKEKNIGILSFLNDETGIADYTEDLYKTVESSFKNLYYLSNKDIADRSAKDSLNVIRCWSTGETDFSDLLEIVKTKSLDIVHVQYHSGSMFPIESLDYLLERLIEMKVKPILTFHAVRGPAFDFIKLSKNLHKWHKIFIHNEPDYKYATESLNNIELLPLPTVTFKKRDKNDLKKYLGLNSFKPIIGAHGLLNKHKNIPEIIKAFSNVKKDYPEALFLSLSAVSSNNILSQSVYKECLNLIKDLKIENSVVFIKDFLSDGQIEALMQTMDIVVFAYDDVGESASASIRKSLAANAITVVTNINMFNEFNTEVIKISKPTQEEIEKALRQVLENSNLNEKIVIAAQKYVQENSYEKRAIEMLKEY